MWKWTGALVGMGMLAMANVFAEESADPAPGGMKLLSGYQHQKLQGIDTHVGKVWKDGGLSIQYDIGKLAGNYAKAQAKDEPLWHKEQVIGGRTLHLALAKDKKFYVTLPEWNANFWGQVKTEEDIADILLMVLTYSPAEKTPK
jgi:hypothetical protein